MHYPASLLFAIALLFTVASTAPIEPQATAPTQLQGRSFKIQRRRRDLGGVPDGGAALDKAYRKYGWTTVDKTAVTDVAPIAGTKQLSAATGQQETGSVSAAQPAQGDAEFLSPVTIGGQQFSMDFDTGSSDLWIFNTKLPAAVLGARKRPNVYDPSKSTTFKSVPGAAFAIHYGDKSKASGEVGVDTIDIGGATVPAQAIELATSVTDGFIQDANADGLLGLGFSNINTITMNGQRQPQPTFFDNVMPTLQEPVFTANLKHSTVGAYEFGTVDSTQFTGTVQFTPIDKSQGFWQFTSNSFAVGGGQVQSNPQAHPAIADTGTTLLLLDDFAVQGYYSAVPGHVFDQTQRSHNFPCNTELPDFHIGLGDSYMGTIPGLLLNFAPASGGNNMCQGAIQSNDGNPLQILGDVMFKAQFVVFDGGNTRIGFAPHATGN
jgi:hypothetical protein